MKTEGSASREHGGAGVGGSFRTTSHCIDKNSRTTRGSNAQMERKKNERAAAWHTPSDAAAAAAATNRPDHHPVDPKPIHSPSAEEKRRREKRGKEMERVEQGLRGGGRGTREKALKRLKQRQRWGTKRGLCDPRPHTGKGGGRRDGET